MSVRFDDAFIRTIKKALIREMKKSRYRHTKGVLHSAVHLAGLNGADPCKTAIAALFHDYAKDYDRDKLFRLAHQYQLALDPIHLHAHQLVHGKVAAAIARHEFKINDQEILCAIEFHTTGRQGMGLIEKIIYLSDFIEPTRDYPGVSRLRSLAERDLDKAVLQALNNTMIYVLKTGKLLHPNTLEARNQLLFVNKRCSK